MRTPFAKVDKELLLFPRAFVINNHNNHAVLPARTTVIRMTAIERKTTGQFAKGNAGGPGRPTIEKERRYVETLGNVCTDHDRMEICVRAVEGAKAGDHRACEWLARYLLGDPQHVSNVLHLHQEVKVEANENPYANASDDMILEAMVSLDRLKKSCKAIDA